MSTIPTTPAWIEAEWPAPRNVHALTTLRGGGCSPVPYTSFNFATHVGDDTACVATNRRQLAAVLQLPCAPVWLEQHHGTRIIDAADTHADRRADGAWTAQPGVVCAILTADCLPILLCDRAGGKIAALHGGWRGLAGGIIESGVASMHAPRQEILAWLGPAIGAARYEVGTEVRSAFVSMSSSLSAAFTPVRSGHWLCDLTTIARMQLTALGVHHISGGGYCTYTDAVRFYSHRRDGGAGRDTGRMASLIWMQPGVR